MALMEGTKGEKKEKNQFFMVLLELQESDKNEYATKLSCCM